MQNKNFMNTPVDEQPFVYKGYMASIEYDRQENNFVGRIKGVIPIMDFTGKDIPELETEFHKRIDDYLAECEAEGKEPCKQYSGELRIDVMPEVHCHIALACEETGMDMEQFLKSTVMGALHRLEMMVSSVQRELDDDSSGDEIQPEMKKPDMYQIYENELAYVNAQINSLGKIFFYRNMAAEIEEQDGFWSGTLLNTNEEYSFEADNIEELYGAFIAAVDEYYEEYREKGAEPYVYYDGFNQVELPPFIDYLVDIIADLDDQENETVLQTFIMLGVSSFIRTIDSDEEKFEIFKQMLGIE